MAESVEGAHGLLALRSSNVPSVEHVDNYILHPDGDVLLVNTSATLGPRSKVQIRAFSAHLELASPFFKEKLAHYFHEGPHLSGFALVEIRLSEDDSMALLLLMRIIHSETKDVPAALTYAELWNVVVLADKYRMVDRIICFAKRWMEPYDVSKMSPPELIGWMTIFKLLGFSYEFELTTHWLLPSATEALMSVDNPRIC